jgi:hypothetical protein
MARKKKEDVQVQDNPGDSDGQTGAAHILNELARQIDIPDDKPAGISLRDQAVLHLVATAELHRFPNDIDMQTHRIKRCIDIANLVVKLLGEDNGEV